MTLPKFSVLAVPSRIFERSLDMTQPQNNVELCAGRAITERTRIPDGRYSQYEV